MAEGTGKKKKILLIVGGVVVVAAVATVVAVVATKKSSSSTSTSNDSKSNSNPETDPNPVTKDIAGLSNATIPDSELVVKNTTVDPKSFNPTSDPETTPVVFTMLAVGDWGSTPYKKSGSDDNPGSCCKMYNSKTNPSEARYKVDFWAQSYVATIMAQSAKELKPTRIIGHGDNFYWDGLGGSKDDEFRFASTFEEMYSDPALKGIKWLNVIGNHDIGGAAYLCGAEANKYTKCSSSAELIENLDLRFKYQQRYKSPDNDRWQLKDHYYVESFSQGGITVDIFNMDTNYADNHGGMQICCQCFGYGNDIAGFSQSKCEDAQPGRPECAGGDVGMYNACIDHINAWGKDSITQATRDIAASKADFKIINTHYSPHHHMSPQKQKELFKLTKDTNVQVYLNGHTHAFSHDSSAWGTHFIENGGGGGIYTSSANALSNDFVTNVWAAGGYPYGFFELSFNKDWLKAQWVTFDDTWSFAGNNLEGTKRGGLRRGHCWFIPSSNYTAKGAPGKKKILIAAGGVVVLAVAATVIAVVATKKSTSSSSDQSGNNATPSPTSFDSNSSSGNATIDTSLLPPKNQTVDPKTFNPTSDPESMKPVFTMQAVGDWGSSPGKKSGSDDNPGSCCIFYGKKTNPSEARYKVDFWAQSYVATLQMQSAKELSPVRVIGHGDNFYWDGLGGTDKASRFANTFEAMYTGALKGVKWVNVIGNHDIGGASYLCGAETAEFLKCGSSDELLKNLRLRAKYQMEYISPDNNRWLLKDFYYVESVSQGGITVDIFNIDTNYADNHGGMQICCQCFGYGSDIPNFDQSKCEDAQPGQNICAGGDTGMYKACNNEINSWAQDSIKQAKRDIAASTADFKIINTHYSPQHHMSPDKQKVLFGLTKDTNVQLWLNGHTHAFSHDTSSWGTHFIENGGGGGIYTKSGNALSNDYVKNVWVAGGNPYGFFELSFSKDWLKAQWVTFDKSWSFGGNNLEGTVRGGNQRGHCWYIPSSNYTAKGAPGVECKSSINTPLASCLNKSRKISSRGIQKYFYHFNTNIKIKWKEEMYTILLTVIGLKWYYHIEMVRRMAAPPLQEELQEKMALPGFDVDSHDLIEQRLENLKRKPTVVQWLDSYVKAVDTEFDDEWKPREPRSTRSRASKPHQSGFFGYILWSCIGIVFSPFIVVFCTPFQRFYGPEKWPFSCTSPLKFVWTAYTNIITLVVLILLVYYILTNELPLWNNLQATRSVIEYSMMVLKDNCIACAKKVTFHEQLGDVSQRIILTVVEANFHEIASLEPPVSIDPACSNTLLQLLSIVVLFWLIIYFYASSTRYLLSALIVGHWVLSSGYIQYLIESHPSIQSIDPPYTLVNEEIVISIIGKDLSNGGTVAWIPSWCSSSTYASASIGTDCTKQFSAPFHNGVVESTFSAVETYIPCYKAPHNKAHEYRCFDNVQLRVKEAKNIPGLATIAL
ncbi:calcineurin-like phosphoesterase [Thraustotheca clavata]|uniref:Calcineurin-like phosphoesterase n=1 Tax=Thraustotheca clavata TaxID=74557 RepID=A0A1V9ZLQ9_9STRA|nr:calcineurin-like phosphoesterase [Thraustotheca clavata]